MLLSRIRFSYVVVLLAAAFFFLYCHIPFGGGFDPVFLTITTFTFAIFAGFFISRQGARQAAVRDRMDDLDGILSFIYRAFGHFSKKSQQRIGAILKKHYEAQLMNSDWARYFTRRSTLLTDIHAEIDDVMDSAEGKKKSHAANRVMAGLLEAQKIRKSLVSLREERVPAAQWLLIIILTAILLITVSLLPSEQQVLASLLKAAFATAVVFVLVILAKFDRLVFFERVAGEHSAKDVLDIIAGEK